MMDWRNRSILGDRAFSMLESVFQIERYIYALSLDF